MDRAILKITSGITGIKGKKGDGKKKRKKNITFSLGGRHNDDWDSEDSSDEDYQPDRKLSKQQNLVKKKPRKTGRPKCVTSSSAFSSGDETDKPCTSKLHKTPETLANRRMLRRKSSVTIHPDDPQVKSSGDDEEQETQIASKSCLKTTSAETSGENYFQLLPYEIIVNIFKMVLANRRAPSIQLTWLSKVCPEWRKITISEKSLWQHVEITKCPRDKKKFFLSLQVNDDGIISHLKSLTINNTKELNTDFVTLIAERAPHLKTLDVSGCTSLRNDSFIVMSEKLPLLCELDITNSQGSVDVSTGLITLLQSHKDRFINLKMAGMGRLRTTQILSCLSEFTCLSVLSISYMIIPRNTDFMEVLRKLSPTLQSLNIIGCDFNHSVPPEEPVPLTKLKVLHAAAITNSECSLHDFLSKSHKLELLDVRHWPTRKLVSLNYLDIHLTALYLSHAKTSSGLNITLVKMIDKLELLCMSWCTHWSRSQIDALMEEISVPGSKISYLRCAGMSITTDQLRSVLSNCIKLDHLDTTSCRGLARGLKGVHNGPIAIDELRRKMYLPSRPSQQVYNPDDPLSDREEYHESEQWAWFNQMGR